MTIFLRHDEFKKRKEKRYFTIPISEGLSQTFPLQISPLALYKIRIIFKLSNRAGESNRLNSSNVSFFFFHFANVFPPLFLPLFSKRGYIFRHLESWKPCATVAAEILTVPFYRLGYLREFPQILSRWFRWGEEAEALECRRGAWRGEGGYKLQQESLQSRRCGPNACCACVTNRTLRLAARIMNWWTRNWSMLVLCSPIFFVVHHFFAAFASCSRSKKDWP